MFYLYFISVQGCKDAWRTLRIMFTRSIKLPPSGSAAKKFSQKTKDMITEMNFIRPYVKSCQELPSNLPLPPSPESKDPNSAERIADVEDIDPDGQWECPRNDNEDVIEQPATAATPQLKRSKQVQSLTTKKRKVQPHTDSEVDSYVMDYLRQKQVESDNPKRLFLLSLLPDLEQMDNHQIRQFRCKVSELIDEILTTRTVATSSSWQTINSHQSTLASNQLSSAPTNVHDWLHRLTRPSQNDQGNSEYDPSAWFPRTNN